MDVTSYLPLYKLTAHELAMKLVREVLAETGITATAGIGTNLYLAKLAMDIVAKHIPPDADGVRIAQLDEESFRYLLWDHRPMTDFWMTGPGTVKKLEAHGIHTMGELARLSLQNEDWLYDTFGVDAEILIDHAWGMSPAAWPRSRVIRPAPTASAKGRCWAAPTPMRRRRSSCGRWQSCSCSA